MILTQDQLQEILENHDLWLCTDGQQGERANLRGANLVCMPLSNANLQWAEMQNADLFMADLSGANLSGADLYGATLSGANPGRHRP